MRTTGWNGSTVMGVHIWFQLETVPIESPTIVNGKLHLGSMPPSTVGLTHKGPRKIWQYVTVISTAASSFIWENVYEYDITFRHLMAFNPSRSWAVTYNQMWNICMREPLPSKTAFTARSGGGGIIGGGPAGLSQRGGAVKKKKSDYCWNFNKGLVCKYSKRCRFIERCSYCDAPSHGVHACPKLRMGEKSSPAASADK